ncbi:MAG: ABC transporter permease [Pseudomonadales bacterium]|nr:ABC transporter permease [Pseudomonadales bacterium]
MTLWFELNYALRLIARKPYHSSLCVVVVAMSLSISLVVFSLVYNTSYKQLDFENSDRWAYATSYNLNFGMSDFPDSIDPFTYQIIEESVTNFAEFGAVQAFAQSRFTVEDRTTIFNTVKISPGLLLATNTTPLLGQTFATDNNNQNLVILSQNVWRNYYGSALDVIGQQTRLNEELHTIIGVMPETAPFPFNFDLLVPFVPETLTQPNLELPHLTPMGMLADGVNLAEAEMELQSIAARLKEQYPEFYNDEESVSLRPLNSFLMEGGSILFSAMAVITLVILLLACINIANLLLSRGLERDQEFAIRNAVGSSRWRLIRQSLLESLILCLTGTALGLFLANLGLNAVTGMFEAINNQIPSGVPGHWVFSLDTNIVVSSVLFTIAIWIFSGLVPAWMFSKPNVDEILKGGSKGTTNRDKFKLSKSLVGFEMFSSCFLLVLCGALLLSIDRFIETDYGFSYEGRMVSDIQFPGAGYDTPLSYQNFYDNLQQEIAAVPDVENLAVTSSLFFSGVQLPYALPDADPIEDADFPLQYLVSVSDNYFQTLDVPIIEGRSFDSSDSADSLQVMIVDEVFARNAWPNESALGKQIQLNPERNGPSYTVVGVTAHTAHTPNIYGLEQVTAFYRPARQRPLRSMSVIVETGLNGSEYLEFMHDSLARVDARVALHNTKPFSEHLADVNAGFSLIGNVFLSITVLTVVLAGTGIFAIISRSVIQRVREAGIRRALGSSNTAVVWIYLKQGFFYLCIGVGLGGGCALFASSALANMFPELVSDMPLIFITVSLGMGFLIGAASWFPSRQAIAMEPGEALHYE